MTTAQKNTIASIFGNKFADYLDANASGWVVERFADTRIIHRGPHTGKMECQAFAATDTAKVLFHKYLGC